MRGADDEAILSAAVAQDAVLLTKDKDFGGMVVRNTQRCNGVVLIRLDNLSEGRNMELVVDVIAKHL